MAVNQKVIKVLSVNIILKIHYYFHQRARRIDAEPMNL